MRIAYLDCFAGIAGDMFLGALMDAGVPAQVLLDTVASLDLQASLRIETVDRSGISCTKVHVLEAGELAEKAHQPEQDRRPAESAYQHENEHGHAHAHSHKHPHEAHSHAQEEDAPLHVRPHIHGRSLTEIRTLIEGAPLAEPVKRMAIQTFELLGRSEARIHNVPVEEIHFHEVGAVDAIVDIVASCAGIHHLGITTWYCSPLNVGGGMVRCAHGTFPVPAPATADLLRGMPTYSAHVQKELITPTGAALLRMLSPTFGQQPPMLVETIGYGAGTRNPAGFPNVLRLNIGQTREAVAPLAQQSTPQAAHAPGTHTHAHNAETVTVLETALDDLSPQVLAHVAERAFEKGALDVMLTPVIMKKGRPGTLLTILCNPSESHAIEYLLLRETSTLGVRSREDRRSCLERSFRTVETPFGEIRMKIGTLAGKEMNVAPEFEDCRAAAREHHVPVKLVQQAAMAAYLR